MEGLKDLLAPKTLHWFSYVANVCWILLGIILSAIFLDTENSEPRFDFHCSSNGDKELIRGKCFEQYEKLYNKFGFPVYGFVIVNVLVTVSICGIYSQAVKKRVDELEGRSRQRNANVTGKRLFKAYCLQLLVRFVLGIFFILLQIKLLYPLSFSSNFDCILMRDGNFADISASASRNATQTQTSYECHNQRASKKTFWSNAVIVVTGTFASFVFMESLFMLSRALRTRNVKDFMEDPNFHKDYLSSNRRVNASPAESVGLTAIIDDDSHTNPPPTAPTDNEPPSEQAQQEFNSRSVATFIDRMKEHVRSVTEQSYVDPAAPFHYNPGEGSRRELTLDHIYTDLIIHENRALYEFSGDRGEQLKEYHRPREESQPKLPGEIFDAKKRKILVVGRPGIGKTMFCKKILRNWARNDLFNDVQKSQMDFKLAFLIRFRKFNSPNGNLTLSLRKLLDESEYSELPLSDDVWHYIIENPAKVLLIFDGFDEYSGKTKINDDDISVSNVVEDSMPLHSLYKKILAGKILPGATVLTTIRPTAVSFFEPPIAFERIVEILDFTSAKEEEDLDNFTKGDGNRAEP